MMSMPDAIRATLELMQAPKESISIRSSYNIAGLSFTPAELASAISEHVPGFRMEYLKDDPRQEIADSWPESIDDSTRSEEHTSELQSLMRNSYAVFCLNKKNTLHILTHATTMTHI